MKNVIVYTTGICPYCVKAKELLNKKGIKFTEIRIDEHPEKAAEVAEKSRGMTTVPQIFIDDYHVGGCDELYALDAAGKLDSMLAD